MIQIVKTNTYSKLEFIQENPLDLETHKKCVAELHRRLAIFDPNAKFSEKYNSFKSNGERIWDGYIRFFNTKNFSFLTGHLPYVEKVLDGQEVEYGIIDKCYRPNVDISPVYELKGITLRDYQKKGVYICTNRTNRGVFYQATNSGKGHSLDTPILTPTGWQEIQNLKVGDYIVAADGCPTRITGLFPRGKQQTYTITFNDHTSIICDADHLWTVQTPYSKKKLWNTLSTKEIIKRNNKLGKRASRLKIPNCYPIQFNRKKLLLKPYVLGVLLGNGSLCYTTPKLTTTDKEIVNAISRYYKVNPISSKNRCQGYSILDIHDIIKQLGLNDVRSWTKFIPKEYLLSDIDDRLAILQGLMDTDGTVCKSGRTVSFSSTSKQLVCDVMYLVRSLGGKAVLGKPRRTIYTINGIKKQGRESYRVYIKLIYDNLIPFRLARKKVRYYNHTHKKHSYKTIVGIKDAGIQETICISINHPSGLYVAKDFIVTHNTIQAIATCESIPVNTLFLVDRVELLDQAYKKFKKHGSREVGVITPQEFEPREVTIGLQRTIWSRLRNQYTRDEYTNYLKSVEMLFVDEVHKSTSSTWKYVLRHMHHAYYRYGLSGTPLLEDAIRNMLLVGFIGRIVQKISNQYLIENGYSAKPLINIVKREAERISSTLDYIEVYRIGITENATRNAQIIDLIKKHSGETILVIVKHLEHGRIIKSSIEKEKGYFVSGQDRKAERISIYNKFKDKKIPIVIATMIYKEGIDISAIDVLIYAAGEKAPVTILQVLGRGLRAREDKKFLKYYDFEDKGHRHLSSHTRKRIKIYKRENFLIEYIR